MGHNILLIEPSNRINNIVELQAEAMASTWEASTWGDHKLYTFANHMHLGVNYRLAIS